MDVWKLLEAYDKLRTEHGWERTDICTQDGDEEGSSRCYPVRAYATAGRRGLRAVWLLAGVHGEEPAGPVALSRRVADIARFAAAAEDVAVVVLPLCNPRGAARGWRYPDAPALADVAGGGREGHSVGDSEWLLPRPGAADDAPRSPHNVLAEARALQLFVVAAAAVYPPLFTVDLHEDCVQASLQRHSYVYVHVAEDAARERAGPAKLGAELVRLLTESGVPPALEGTTAFGEEIHGGIVVQGADGSIDELLGAKEIIVEGKRVPGPAAAVNIVVETPGGVPLETRVAAMENIICSLPKLLSVFLSS